MILQKTIEKTEQFAKTFVETLKLALDEKGKTASGKTKKSIKFRILPTVAGLDLSFTAASHWKYVGSGRPPGAPPPVQKIQEWLNSKQGVQGLNAYAIAKKMGKEGSRDYRLKRPNIFLQEVEGITPKISGLLTSGIKADVTTEVYKGLKQIAA